MRLLFVADGRSQIALNWIQYFVEQGHAVHLASTYPCEPDLELASLHFATVALSGIKGSKERKTGTRDQGTGNKARRREGIWGAKAVGLRTAVRQWLGPLTLGRAAKRLSRIIEQVRPELVHAMRIPYEGMMAALSSPRAPLLVSVWGNDFSLHAPSTPLMRRYTRLALERSSGLHADCYRDVRLARAWGLPSDRPAIVLPGGGGVQLEIFYPPDTMFEGDPQVINPRGVRAYVRNDTFFRAIPEVVKRLPKARFLCVGMADEPQAMNLLEQLGIARNVKLLPRQSRTEMAELFRQSQVVVSPSTHDGTPNTLLEAMACGCFPVVGDIESLREWITPGVNGLLVDPTAPADLAQAMLLALEQPELRKRGRTCNLDRVTRRAEHIQVMRQAERFYKEFIS